MVLSNSEKPLMEKLNLTVDQLDYKYIENCKNVKQLERVLRVLRSGEEGIYPHLIKFCEDKLKELDPNNKYLQLPKRIVNYSDLPEAERKSIISDLEVWSKNYSDEIPKNVSETEILDIPPVRRDDSSKQVKNDVKKKSQNIQEANRRVCKPRSYDEWNKFNVEEELEKLDDANKDKTETEENKEAIEINKFIPTFGLTLDERERIADLERIKGNEAFKAQDYEEAILYYTRSISALKAAKTLNNRAQAYLKLKNYFAAVVDCNEVISLEPSNVKALFRRGIAHKEAEMFDLAIIDFEILLKLEPENKSAQDQLKQIENMKLQKMQARKKVVIEEIDSESSYDVGENSNVPDLHNKEISKRLTIEETTEDFRPTLDEICNCERNDDGIQPLSAKTKEMLNIFRDPSALANNSKNGLVSNVKVNSQKKTSHKNAERNTSPVLGELSEQTESKKDFKEIEIQDKNPEKPKIKINHFESLHEEFSKNTILESELKTYLESNLECENKHVDGNLNKDLNKSTNKALSVTEEIKNEPQPNANGILLKKKKDLIDCKLDFPASLLKIKRTLIVVVLRSSDGKLVTPFEFFHMWLSNNCNINSNNGAICLLNIQPQQLPRILTNKIDGPLLNGLLMAIKAIANAGKMTVGFEYLKSLTKVPRIKVTASFLSTKEKMDIEDLLLMMENKLETNLNQVRDVLINT